MTDDGGGEQDFDAEPDIGFDPQDKEIETARKLPFLVDFNVLSPSDIRAQQEKQVDVASAIVGLSPEATAILLRHFRWNQERLIESYMDHPDEVLDHAGLGSDSLQTARTEVIAGFTCDICFEDDPTLETYSMRCHHRYCVDCYRHYLAQKIREEGEAARIQCPKEGCKRIVDSKSLDLLVTPDLKERYAGRWPLKVSDEWLNVRVGQISKPTHPDIRR